MRRTHQQKLTPLQQKWLARAIILILLSGVLWLVFAPGKGLIALHLKRNTVQSLEEETGLLKEDNAKLTGDIEKMKNDPGHLEEVARRDFDLLKKNERVYDFSRKKKEKEEEN